MIFTEIRFLLLLAGCWLTFFAVPPARRPLALVVWGLVFYGIYAAPYLPLVLALTVATYMIARGRPELVMVCLVAMLFARFKLGVDLTGIRAASGSGPVAAILIPLGFSFLAFELLHVVLDHQRGKLTAVRFIDLMAFALYFPCRVAGPIKRYPAFMSAIAAAEPSSDNIYAGTVRIIIGLFKKFVIADLLALTASEMSYAATPVHVWKVVFAYSLQIYFDFSAYSDLAIGASRILGISIPENFNWPYLSTNIQDFWNRWHMTLSGWARDYVFTPTGRLLFTTPLRRTPLAIAAVSFLATFLVIGAWHGLTAGYIAWGAYHGALVTGYYVYRKKLPATIIESRWFQSRLLAMAAGCVTFLFVSIGWVPFMVDFPRSLQMLAIMFGR